MLQVNECAAQIQSVMAAKYKLLSTPRSTLGSNAMKKWTAFKDEETDDTKGLFFVTEDNIKVCGDACVAIIIINERY